MDPDHRKHIYGHVGKRSGKESASVLYQKEKKGNLERIFRYLAGAILLYSIISNTALCASTEVDYQDIDAIIRQGRADKAERILKTRISESPDDHVALTALGGLYLYMGDQESSLKVLRKSLSIDRTYPLTHLHLGRAYQLNASFDKAVIELLLFKSLTQPIIDASSEVKLFYVNAMFYLSEIYYAEKRYDDFKDELEEIISIYPQDQMANYNLGLYFYRIRRERAQAYRFLNICQQIDPSSDLGKHALYAIEYIRSNPDPRFAADLSFLETE